MWCPEIDQKSFRASPSPRRVLWWWGPRKCERSSPRSRLSRVKVDLRDRFFSIGDRECEKCHNFLCIVSSCVVDASILSKFSPHTCQIPGRISCRTRGVLISGRQGVQSWNLSDMDFSLRTQKPLKVAVQFSSAALMAAQNLANRCSFAISGSIAMNARIVA